MGYLINDTLFPAYDRIENKGICVYQKLELRNKGMECFDDNDSFEVPYIRETAEFVRRHHNNLGRVIVVSNSEPVAVKCAKYIIDHDGGLDENDKYDEEFDFVFEEEPMDTCLIDFDRINITEKLIPGNPYVQVMDMLETRGVIVEGMGDNAQGKVDALLACSEIDHKCIIIEPSQLNEQWVTDLQMKKGFVPLIVSNVDTSYYCDVFNHLLADAGYALPPEVTAEMIINRIRKKSGRGFCEEDIDWMIIHAIENHGKNRNGNQDVLKESDFAINADMSKSAEEKLREMVGLEDVKNMVVEYTAVLKEGMKNKALGDMHTSMVFFGNPGTGKTTCAQLLAEIMADKGVSNASFTMASRADIIGEYVGHTASKVEKLFNKARGGVLFVDEAGFFLNTDSGGYVAEAMKEFVRFMELYPDVTVIFAMYEREADGFLKLDEGLSSRISRMIAFEDYSDEELGNIFVSMLKKRGYAISRKNCAMVMDYLTKLKGRKNFGNAREVRKIVESIIVMHSVRLNSDNTKRTDGKIAENVISMEDVTEGIRRLEKHPVRKNSFGFQSCPERKIVYAAS